MKKIDRGRPNRNSKPRYLDPTVDFAFKRIFGTETNKDLLISFLNELFRGRKKIKDLTYNKNEYVGDTSETGGVIFDLTCTASTGEQFIIEVQRTAHINLKQRMLYYGSKLIAEQAPKGKRREWNYSISEVYVVVLMDGFRMPKKADNPSLTKDNFRMSEPESTPQYLHDICLCERDTGKLFYNNYGFIYIELINFTKEEAELQSDLDSWLYVLKNMSRLDKIPLYLRKPIFEKLFNIAEYTNLNRKERDMYDTDLKRKWDKKVILDYHEEKGEKKGLIKGRKEGMEKGKKELISNMIEESNFSDAKISSLTRVPVERVQEIRAELKKEKDTD